MGKLKCRVCGEVISRDMMDLEAHLSEVHSIEIPDTYTQTAMELILEWFSRDKIESSDGIMIHEYMSLNKADLVDCYDAEDFDCMTVAPSLEKLYEMYDFVSEPEESVFFDVVCDHPDGKIYMLKEEWR